MKTIYKYEISPDINYIEIPKDAEILSLHVQNNKPCIWVLVDTEKDIEERYFEFFGTGHYIPCDMGIDRKFIGTFLIDSDSLVFHLFERL